MGRGSHHRYSHPGVYMPTGEHGGPETSATIFKRLIYVHFYTERVNNSKWLRIILITWFILYILEKQSIPIMYETWHFSFLSPRMNLVAISHVSQVTSKVSSFRGILTVGSAWRQRDESYSEGFILDMSNVEREKETDLAQSILNSACFQSLTNHTTLC